MNGETGTSLAGYVHVIATLAHTVLSSLFTMLLHIYLAFEILFEICIGSVELSFCYYLFSVLSCQNDVF